MSCSYISYLGKFCQEKFNPFFTHPSALHIFYYKACCSENNTEEENYSEDKVAA
jgi:hypothetical protein